MELIQRLIDHWTQHGIKCPAGVTAAEIATFELRYGVQLPSDLRSYFLAVDGMGRRDVYDEDFFQFWPLSEVISIAEFVPDRCSEFPDASRYFIFADHSICLPAFAIRLSSDPAAATPVASVFADFGQTFAVEDQFKSFTDFLDLHLLDPWETVRLPFRR